MFAAPQSGTRVTADNIVPGVRVSASRDYCWHEQLKQLLQLQIQQQQNENNNNNNTNNSEEVLLTLIGPAQRRGWCEVACGTGGHEQTVRIGADGAYDLVYGAVAEPPLEAQPCPAELDGRAVTIENFVAGAEVTAGPHWRWSVEATTNDGAAASAAEAATAAAGGGGGAGSSASSSSANEKNQQLHQQHEATVGVLLRRDPENLGCAFIRWPGLERDLSVRIGLSGAFDVVYGRVAKPLAPVAVPDAVKRLPVTPDRVYIGATVCRGAAWRPEYGMQDGGGKPGMLMRVRHGRAFVVWSASLAEHAYRIDERHPELVYGTEPAQDVVQPRYFDCNASSKNNQKQQQQKKDGDESTNSSGGAAGGGGGGGGGRFTLVDRWQSIDACASGHVMCVRSTCATVYSAEVVDPSIDSVEHPVECCLVVSRLLAGGFVGLGVINAASAACEACASHLIGEVAIADSIGVGIEEESRRAFLICDDQKKYPRALDTTGITTIYLRLFRGAMSFLIDCHPFHCPQLESRRYDGDWRVGVSFTTAGTRAFFSSGPHCQQRARRFVETLISLPRSLLSTQQQQRQQLQTQNQTQNQQQNRNSSSSSPSSFTWFQFAPSIHVMSERALVCRRTQRATTFSLQVFDAALAEFEETLTIHGGLRGGDVAFGFVDEAPTTDCVTYLAGEMELFRSFSLLLRGSGGGAAGGGDLSNDNNNNNNSVSFLYRDQLIGAKKIPRRRNKNKNQLREEGQAQPEEEEQLSATFNTLNLREEEEEETGDQQNPQQENEEQQKNSDYNDGEEEDEDIEITIRFSRGTAEFSVNGYAFRSSTHGAPVFTGMHRLACSLSVAGQVVSLGGVDDMSEVLLHRSVTEEQLAPAEPAAALAGELVTTQNFDRGVLVSRGRDWRAAEYGNQDDGGKAGVLISVEGESHVWVKWLHDGSENRYRASSASEFCDLRYGAGAVAAADDDATAKTPATATSAAGGGAASSSTTTAAVQENNNNSNNNSQQQNEQKQQQSSGRVSPIQPSSSSSSVVEEFHLTNRWRSLAVSNTGEIECSIGVPATAYSEETFSSDANNNNNNNNNFSVHLLILERAKAPVALGIVPADATEQCSRNMVGDAEISGSIAVGVSYAAAPGPEAISTSSSASSGGAAGGGAASTGCGAAATTTAGAGALQVYTRHQGHERGMTDVDGKFSDSPVILSMRVSCRDGSVVFAVDGVPLHVDAAAAAASMMTLVPGRDYRVGVSLIGDGQRCVFATGDAGYERLLAMMQAGGRIEESAWQSGKPFNMLDLTSQPPCPAIAIARRSECECVANRRGTVVSREVFQTVQAHFRLEVRIVGGTRGGDIAIGVVDAQPNRQALATHLCGEAAIAGSVALLIRKNCFAVLCDGKVYDKQEHELAVACAASTASSSEPNLIDNDAKEFIVIIMDVRHRRVSFEISLFSSSSSSSTTVSNNNDRNNINSTNSTVQFPSTALPQIMLLDKMRVAVGLSKEGQRVEF